MPVVTVEMYEGRSEEQKQNLVEDITDAMVDNVDATPETLHVIIHDVPKENWGRDGLLGTHRED
jgi:4-oxalocrotonate tautomerase